MRIIRVFTSLNSCRLFHASVKCSRRGSLRAEVATSSKYDKLPGFHLTDNYVDAANSDDVFGIENDVGAIFVEPAEPNLQKFRNLVQTKGQTIEEVDEVVIKTSFGHIRRDGDNEKKYGRMPKPKLLVPDIAKNNFNKISKILVTETEVQPEVQQSELNSTNESVKRVKSAEKSQIVLQDFSQSEVDSKMIFEQSNEKNNQSHHVIKDRNKSDGQSEKGSDHADQSVHSTVDKQLKSEFSYIDQSYFSSDFNPDSLVKSADFSKSCEIDNSKHSVKSDTCLSDSSASGLGYIDEMYFNEAINKINETTVTELEHEQPIVSTTNNDVQNNLKTDEFMDSEIDKQYFNSQWNVEQLNENKKVIKELKMPKFVVPERLENELVDNEEALRRFNKILPGRNKNRFRWQMLDDALDSQSVEEDSKEITEISSDEKSDGDKTSEMKAYDYVKKLREEKISQGTSAGRTDRGIKLDSKGFRILSSQVPDLSHLTHHELVTELKMRILFSDDNLIVLDKPYNLVVHEAKTNKEPNLECVLDELAKTLDNKASNPKLYTVHRLDKTTTGCLLLARNETTAQYVKSLFAQRKISKTYWIVTSGVPEHTEGVIDIPIAEGTIGNKSRMVLHPKLEKETKYRAKCKNGKPAVTRYSVIASYGNAALVEANSETGLKHQIRVHFGFGLNCPIIGDHKYSNLTKFVPQKLPSDILQRLRVRQSKVRHIPMHIHARRIVLPNYLDGRNLFVSAPLPRHMSDNLQSLKIRKQ